MNSQKQITISELKGKFSKDFDTFGKMDPFLEFAVGKCITKSDTATGAGKEPVWKNSVVLTYFDELNIIVKAYDEDQTENQFIGSNKIDIKSLRFPGGTLELNITTEGGENVGSISAKYTIKNLSAVPLLIIKNLKCDFIKQHSFISKTKPYLQFKTEQGSNSTEHKQEAKGLIMTWNGSLRLRIKENSKINISLLDKNDNQNIIFKYQCNSKEFRFQNGIKKFNVLDSSYLILGTLQFDFQTVNLVSKEQSVKNADKQKKSQNELTSITIERIKTDLKQGNKDIYFRFLIGSNFITTDVIQNVAATSNNQIKRIIYAETKQNRLYVLLWEKNILKDKVIGTAVLSMQGLTSGDKKIIFMDAEGKQQMGSAILTIFTKQVPSTVLLLDNITVFFVEGGDIIGQSEPYVMARIGGWSGRTQTGQQNRNAFKKSIQLKYFEEDTLILQIWDEDLTNDEVLYSQKINISDLKGSKGEMTINLTQKDEKKLEKKGKITFKYDLKVNVIISEVPKKNQQKVFPTEVKPQIKIEPKIQPKSQQLVKIQNIDAKAQPKYEQKLSTERNPSEIQKNQVLQINLPSARQKKLTEKQYAQKSDLKDARSNSNKNIESNLVSQRLQTNKNTNRSLNKDSIHRSKETLNLPSIISSHQNYGDKIFDKQSVATLQKTILVYSMPKATRFSNEPKYSGQPSYCLDSCFKLSASKGVGFGFGRKKQYPDWMERNMKENPPPGAYFDNNSDNRLKGPTFGISHKFYQKVLIPKQQRNPSQISKKLSPIRDPPK